MAIQGGSSHYDRDAARERRRLELRYGGAAAEALEEESRFHEASHWYRRCVDVLSSKEEPCYERAAGKAIVGLQIVAPATIKILFEKDAQEIFDES